LWSDKAVASAQAAAMVVVALDDRVGTTLLLLVPAIVGEERVAPAYGRLEAFRSVGSALGPALAGILVAALGSRVTLLADAGTFVLVAAILTVVAVRREPVSTARQGWARQVREGVSVLGRHRPLATVIAALGATIVLTATVSVARVFFIREDVGAGSVLRAARARPIAAR